jgi:hypothetical protein
MAAMPQPGDADTELVECTGDDEKNVARIDGFARDLSFSLEFQGGLQLGLEIIAASERNFGFLHELEQGSLYAATAHVASDHLSRAGNLVDFVDVDDSILGKRSVAVGLVNKLANEIFDVTADIACFAELCGVGFNKGDAHQIRDVLDKISLTDARRSDKDDVLFSYSILFPSSGDSEAMYCA